MAELELRGSYTGLAEEEAARQREFERLEALEWQRLLAEQQARRATRPPPW